jgi:hypothetical protein
MKPETESDRPVIFVLFGAAGDLSQRLILPALYTLHRDGQLPACFALIGADRVSLSNQRLTAGYRQSLTTQLQGLPSNAWTDFAVGSAYLQGDFVDRTPSAPLGRGCGCQYLHLATTRRGVTWPGFYRRRVEPSDKHLPDCIQREIDNTQSSAPTGMDTNV